MPFGQDLRVINSERRRTKIFVDYWNLVIQARSQTKNFSIELKWDKLADLIVGETRTHFEEGVNQSLAGCFIFGSYSKSDPRQYASINRTLDMYGSIPGIFFDFKERITKETKHKCSNCQHPVERSSELGIDVLLTVEMIKHAMMKEHEYLALVSSDRDYIPLLQFLRDQGQRVVHVATGDAHRDMRAATWQQISLKEAYHHICAIDHSDRLILTSPGASEKTSEAIKILDGKNFKYTVIDITNKEQISDKDLEFILKNQRITFRKLDILVDKRFDYMGLGLNIYDFRKCLLDRSVYGALPYIMLNGEMEVHYDAHWNWVISAGNGAEFWKEFQHKDF